ncbi:DUF2971 domain-containing protein [Pontibacillus sp. HMF3514]|uniref:DUF2971 domain-containing protein n=1 Tax=Pontibacillus sp. HMF3514 TaxID=2692425 RepID=UPI001F2DAF62|nr:DUF2971 domain-containing protein [Pontibacillus sp. HMF3514]
MAFIYNRDEWSKRIRNRSDMSGYLIHLTKEYDGNTGMNNLIKILEDKTLYQSDPREGFIIGNQGAVCFQDVPVYGASQNSFYEQNLRELHTGMKVRYKPIGIAFRKEYVFNKGGRPVIYERKEKAKSFIPQEEWWRIVNFDLSNPDMIVDWTHEREWRHPGDFEFDLKEAFVLLTQHKTYGNFVNKVDQSIINGIGGITVLDPVLS